MGKGELFFEDVIERIGHVVLWSTVRKATKDEIADAERLHILGKCPHNIIYDEAGYLYDLRTCHTCGISLGTV
ncbi:MAG: hypothetical protein KAS32_16790 [Candidatus Peribacteraceae bacterium]|nr:hypothetical protein [Candidatus Peribacteraceae bacterium]